MSWVTDVLLLFSLGELYDDDGEEIKEVTPLNNINFKFLKIDDFIKIVKTQAWREPHNGW